MSDLFIYELEDIIWDEFDQTGDHIVPHPCHEHWIERELHSDSYKKPLSEIINISSKAADLSSAKYLCQTKGGGGFKHPKKARETMLEKDSWSHTPGGAFCDSCDNDSNKEVTSLTPDNTRLSSCSFKRNKVDSIGTEFCTDGPMVGERCVADSDSYDCPLGDISRTENELSFFNNDGEDKESNDLLYYGWPDIGNFDDVDRMFSCDSTFGLGSINNEDDLNWFPSSPTVQGSEDILKSYFKFSHTEPSPFKSMPEHLEHSQLNNTGSSANDSTMNSASIGYKSSFWTPQTDRSDTLGHLTLVNGSDAISETKNGLTPKEQGLEFNGAVYSEISTVSHSKDDSNGLINFHRKRVNHHNQPERKRKDRCLENGGSSHHIGRVGSKGTKAPPRDSSHQVFASQDAHNQKKSMGPESFDFLQSHSPCVHLNYSQPLDQIPVSSTPSGFKSGSNNLKGSYYASNKVQSMEGSFGAPAIVDDKREKLQSQQGFHSTYLSSPENVDLVVQTRSCDPISAEKHLRCSQNEVDGAGIVSPADLDSSNVQENSCQSSGLDEISLEASSFHQLQQVMEKLDTRTKLCIRDSLYRLARNAEQRHHQRNLTGGSMDDGGIGGVFMGEGTNQCSGFIDVETNTNPIDRSIAHLLFHRPSDSSAMLARDGPSPKSCTMIHGSITSPPMMAESAGEGDKRVASH
ncbi:protein LNK1 isoform X2 [Diospyros lotus]|uniref:protein LNK1 isoform X2 n=1 Tax=Diospyros lotus TaxID=55363 RepID=UPI00224E74D2|nr:protein LNK1 isoform X2 [Diospyros lotus]